MTDRPIIFSAAMVQALLSGRKTMTRRIMKPQPPEGTQTAHLEYDVDDRAVFFFCGEENARRLRPILGGDSSPYTLGDRLWVREAWHTNSSEDGKPPSEIDEGEFIWYVADGAGGMPISRMRPSIHMPRWASRLTLLVTEIRVQRLQDITEEDAAAEGARSAFGEWFDAGFCQIPADRVPFVTLFSGLWGQIHGANAWAENPWVVAVSFSVQHANIDALPVRP